MASSSRHTGRRVRARVHDHEVLHGLDGKPDEMEIDSRLVLTLLKKWATGQASACEVQSLCNEAYKDQAKMLSSLGLGLANISKCLENVAALGNWGKWPGNVKRDLLRLLGEPSCPQQIEMQLPCLVAKPRGDDAVETISVPCMAPHLVVAHLYEHHRWRFDELLFGGPFKEADLLSFWKSVVERKDPRIIKHPMALRPDWAKKAIPISIHGDAVPCVSVGKAGSKSFDCYSWQSLLARGATSKVKQYIFGLFESSKTAGTMQEAWAVILWSLEAAFLGQHPHTNYDGLPCARLGGELLCGGFFLVPWSLKGDLDYFAKGLGLRHYQAKEFCEFCPANESDDVGMRWNNFRLDASWKRQLFTVSQWRAVHPELHWIFKKFEFVTLHNVEPDELHIMYLGTVAYMLGSVMWVLCYIVMPDSPAANMKQLWSFIVGFYSSHQVTTQFSNLSLSSFTDENNPKGSYPKLKGKGAEVQNLVWPMLEAWKHFGGHEAYHFDSVKALLERQLDIQSVLSEWSDCCFLPMDGVRQIQAACDDVLRLYSKLANAADEAGHFLWSVAPKFHWMWHLCQRASYLNPRANSCMIDEDYVGDIKEIVAASTSGTSVEHVPSKTMEKIRWCMHFNTTNGEL